MLTIKEFKKGDRAYSVLMNRGRNSEPVISEVEVKSVGRMYVTTGDGAWKHKYMNWNAEYLHEKVSVGESSLLFKTSGDANDYIEKCDLALWLGGLSVSAAENYSLQQLRDVRNILK